MPAGSYFKQACPSCEALVPIPDKSYIGKKIPCPNCKYRFVVEDPAAKDKAVVKSPATARGKAAGEKAAAQAELEEEHEDGQEATKGKDRKEAGKAGSSLLENKKILAGLGLAVVGVIGLAVAAFFLLRPSQGPASRNITGSSAGIGNWQPETTSSTSGKTEDKKDKKDESSAASADLLPPATAALTNLLPPGTERVSRLHFQNLLDSSAGQTLLRPLTVESLRKELGFSLKAVDEVLRAESFTNKWAFNIIHVREALDEKVLATALGLKPAAGSPINNHNFYQATRNLPWLHAFAHLSLAPHGGLPLEEKEGAQRPLLVYVHDRQTLITGDVVPVTEFLRANGQFPQQVVAPKPAPSGPPGGVPGAPPTGPFPPPGIKPGQFPMPPGAPGNPAPPSGAQAGPPPGAPVSPPVQPPLPPGAGGAAPGQPTSPPGTPSSPPGGPPGAPPALPGAGPPGPAGPPGTPPGMPPFSPPGGTPPGQPNPGVSSDLKSTTVAYLTIKPALKAMLDHLEEMAGPGKILFSSAIDLTAAHSLPSDTWARLRQLWDVTLTLESHQEKSLQVLGLAIVQHKPSWFQFINSLETEREEDAVPLQRLLLEGTAPQVVRFFDVFGHKVEISTGSSGENTAQSGVGTPAGPFPPGIQLPGTIPPGGAPPGSFPPGGVPPGSFPPGVVPPGITPPGSQPPAGEPPPGFQPPFPPQSGSQPPAGPPPGFQPPGFPPPGGFPPGYQPPGFPGGRPTPKSVTPETEPKQSQLVVRRQGKTVSFVLDVVLSSGDQEKWETMFQVLAAGIKGQLDAATPQDRRPFLGQGVRQLGEQGVPDKVKAGHFPPATFSPEAGSGLLRLPEHRLSWMTSLLPYLGQEPLFRAINWDRPWDHPSNWLVGRALIPEFIDPYYPEKSRRVTYPGVPVDLGATHYVGIAGVGLEAADYPDEPAYRGKLGIFGYNRSLALQRVAAGHGLSNTILLLEVPPDSSIGLTPWIAGGGSTVRGVPEKNSIQPFVADHGGQRGTFAVMADGSVRFISAEIADDLFQRMCQVDLPPLSNFDINQVAPLVPPSPALAPAPPKK